MTDLDTIMSGRTDDAAPDQNAPQVEQPSVEQENDGGQPRDPQGRFAANEQQPTQVQQPDPAGQQKPMEGYIPIQALDARLAKQQERFEAQLRQQEQALRQQFEQQFRQPQQPVQRPDFFENPDAAFDARLREAVGPIQQGQQGIVENFSRMLAAEKFGEDAVQAAYAEMSNRIASNPNATRFDYQRIMSSPHPYGELVKWHKAQSALTTYGDDPEAYIKAEIERRMAAAGGQQPNPNPPVQPGQIPSSFSSARSAGSGSAPQWGGPKPLSEIMNR